MDKTQSRKAIQGLENLYADLDAEIERLGLECRGCGRCCHFDEMEHTLFASDLEIDFLLDAVAGTAPAAKPGRCPFQADEKCRAHNCRPLGCRLYFCRVGGGRALGGEVKARLDELSSKFHQRLKELHKDLGIKWHYRSLLLVLKEKLSL